MDMELEAGQRQLLMLKECSNVKLSCDGFGCNPRHLAAKLRSASGTPRNGDVIARVGCIFVRMSGRGGHANQEALEGEACAQMLCLYRCRA
jgi:hypothetical protein